MSGDEIVHAVVTNIQLGGICSHFRKIFKKTPAPRLIFLERKLALAWLVPAAPVMNLPRSQTKASGGKGLDVLLTWGL